MLGNLSVEWGLYLVGGIDSDIFHSVLNFSVLLTKLIPVKHQKNFSLPIDLSLSNPRRPRAGTPSSLDLLRGRNTFQSGSPSGPGRLLAWIAFGAGTPSILDRLRGRIACGGGSHSGPEHIRGRGAF